MSYADTNVTKFAYFSTTERSRLLYRVRFYIMRVADKKGLAMAFDMYADELSLLRHFRRELHAIPELDDELPCTLAYVKGVLRELHCEVLEPCKSCVCARFVASRATGAPLAFRADMDALPILEETGVPFASTHEGCMHACGHDAHMAMALTAAVVLDRRLCETRDALAQDVLFVFQPAEETTGGAARVCASGIFQRFRIARIFGFHVWPDLPAGHIFSKAGALLARSCEVHIACHGESLHVGKTLNLPDEASHDAALAAAHFASELHGAMAKLAEVEPVVCRFGLLKAGTVCNVLADKACLLGTLRSFSDTQHSRAKTEIEILLQRSTDAFGCTYELEYTDGYPPVVNDESLFERVSAQLNGQDGAPCLERLDVPYLMSEDFSFYQRCLPGLFILLGIGDPAHVSVSAASGRYLCVEEAPQESKDALSGGPAPGFCRYAPSALHTDTLMFDEELLLPGLAAYMRLMGLA